MPGFYSLDARVQSLEATRRDSLGYLSSVHLADLPLVATQAVANGVQPFLNNLWGGLQEVFPVGSAEIRPTDPTGVAGTIGNATVVRVYEDLEGILSVRSQVEIEDQTAGTTTWTFFAVSGVDLDTVAGTPAFGVITSVTAIGGTSNQNDFTDVSFRNLATIRPFPGTDGTGRRFIDLAFQISHQDGVPRTIQIRQSYGELLVIATDV